MFFGASRGQPIISHTTLRVSGVLLAMWLANYKAFWAKHLSNAFNGKPSHLHKHGGEEGFEANGSATNGEARGDSEVNMFNETRKLAHHTQVAQEVLVAVHDTQVGENILKKSAL